MPPGILAVNRLAKTPTQILDIPGLFNRIHELQKAVDIALTSVAKLEGQGKGTKVPDGGDDGVSVDQKQEVVQRNSALSEWLGGVT
jgi:hypothetical protein